MKKYENIKKNRKKQKSKKSKKSKIDKKNQKRQDNFLEKGKNSKYDAHRDTE